MGAVAPSTEAAMAIGPAVMLVWIVFGGYYVNAGRRRERPTGTGAGAGTEEEPAGVGSGSGPGVRKRHAALRLGDCAPACS